MRLRIFVLGYFHSFHKHMRSLLRIHPSSLLKTDFVSARAKYPHHPIRYWFSLCILYSIEYGIFLDVISRTLFFILWMLSLAMRILGSLEIVKLKPRNLRFHGRSTDDLLSFTFRRNFFSTNRWTLAIVRSPARLDFTYMLQSSAYRTNLFPLASNSLSSSSSTMFESSGLKGPPCGVPSSVLETTPLIMTPACRYLRISLSNILS